MENPISLSQATTDIWRVTKKYGFKVGGLLLIAYIGAACGAQPNIKFEMTDCGGVRGLELKPGDVVDLGDVGPEVNFKIDNDGRIVPSSKDIFGVTDPGQEYWFGDREKPYYLVRDQGDPDSNGLTNIEIEKVCPPKSTPSPQPSETPIGFLKGNVRSVVQADRGFNPGKDVSKPARNFPVFRRG